MGVWKTSVECKITLDATTFFHCHGFNSHSEDGRESVTIRHIPDLPTCLISPLLSMGWTPDMPFFDVLNAGSEVRMKRTLEIPFDGNGDINDNFQLIAEGTIKKEGDSFKTEMTILNPYGKIDTITKHRLESIETILPFRETLFDVHNERDTRLEKERTIDATGTLFFLTKSKKTIRGNICTLWTYTGLHRLTSVDVLESPIVRMRKINCSNLAYRNITIDAKNEIYGSPGDARHREQSESSVTEGSTSGDVPEEAED